VAGSPKASSPAGQGVAVAAVTALVGILYVGVAEAVLAHARVGVAALVVAFAWPFAFVAALPSGLASVAAMEDWRKARAGPAVLAAILFWASMAGAWAVAIAWSWPHPAGAAVAIVADLAGAALYAVAVGIATRDPAAGGLGAVWAALSIATPSLLLAGASGWQAVALLGGLAVVTLAGVAVYECTRRGAASARPARSPAA